MDRHIFNLIIICVHLYLCLFGISSANAQEANAMHRAYVKEQYGIDLPYINDSILNKIKSKTSTKRSAARTLSYIQNDGLIPEYNITSKPFILHHTYQDNISMQIQLQDTMDVLITNSLLGTQLYANIILINNDLEEIIEPTRDCHKYYDYAIFQNIGLGFQSQIPSSWFEKLPPGNYMVHIFGSGPSIGSNRIETIIAGAPSKQIAGGLKYLRMPLRYGFHYDMPINMGTFSHDFTYEGSSGPMSQYIGFHSGSGYNIVYDFELTGNEPIDLTVKEDNSRIYLLDNNRTELASGASKITAKLGKGKYFCVFEKQETTPLDVEMTDQVDDSGTDPGGNEPGGGSDGGDTGGNQPGNGSQENWIPTGKSITVNYTYNIRSWTTNISSSHFSQKLYYNESNGNNTPQYNGNISSIEWRVDNSNRAYNFSYDQLSRLTAANYTGQANERYGTSYSYDKHGNILTLERLGKKDAGDSQTSWGVVDQLSFTYNGNQLKSINDTVKTVDIAGSADFKGNAAGSVHYAFNRNGAMTQDLNKGITNIDYNSLNLPISMDISNGMNLARNEYLYTASGVKLQVKHSWNKDFTTAATVGSGMTSNEMDTTKVIDYVGNKIYENGELKKILVDGGYYDYEKQEYFFYIQDHLGNNRVVVNQNDSVVQRSDYYPFGMEFADNSGNDQPYKYNGKELDKMHGLNMYDYSARHVDPVYGRFTSVDPLAEKYYNISPYAYCLNNPIIFIDPDGRDPGKPGDWLTLGYNLVKAATVKVSLGLQMSVKLDASGVNAGATLNVASMDILGLKDGEFFLPGYNMEKSEINQEVEVQIEAVGIGIKNTIKNQDGKMVKEESLHANVSFVEFENKTTTEVKSTSKGEVKKGKSTTETTTQVKDAGVKTAAIVGFEFTYSWEKAWGALQKFIFE